MRAILFLVVLSMVSPLAAGAQGSAVVDEGTFSVTRKGVPLGRESFRIVRAPAPGGQAFQATGISVLGDSKVSSRLGTDSTGVPVSYDVDLTEKGQLVQRLQGKGRPGRFAVLATTRTGESAREYVLNNGALLLDKNVFHHFFFVALAAQHVELIVIEPRTARQGRLRLEQRGEESVEIAGRTIAGRRFTLVGTAGSRDVWVDQIGRLLKVSVPDEELVALRDDPPR